MTLSTTATAPAKSDYINDLLQDVAYEVIRREGFHVKLTNAQWDAESLALAAQMRPAIDKYIADHCE